MKVRSLAQLENVAAGYLAAYTNPAGHYAFRTYDQSPVHDGPIAAADVLMANLLSLRLDWRDVTPLFTDGDTEHTRLRRLLDAALDEARGLPPLEDCDERQVLMPALRMANEAAGAAPLSPRRKKRTWSAVTVSKVLHRLAPTVPLVDSHVMRFYGTTWAGDVRQRMRLDLERNRHWLSVLAADHPLRGEPMPLTRVADIAVWMDGMDRSRVVSRQTRRTDAD